MTNKPDEKYVKAREELVAMGLLRDSGRRRGGEIVWEITELGKQAAESICKIDEDPPKK